jgi:phosphatidylglycerol---prolipoprotein diacylglyceryl transferase
MYPDLGFFVKNTFGIEIPGLWLIKIFGLMMALAFLAAGYILSLEMRRKERDGFFVSSIIQTTVGEAATMSQLFWTFLYGFVVGGKFSWIVLNFQEFGYDPAKGLFSPQKINILVGLIVGAIFAYSKYYEKQKDLLPQPKIETHNILPSERVGDLIIVAAISGLIGAKLFAVMEYTDQLIADPMGTLFSGSGLAFFGGLIGGTIACILYARYLKMPLLHLADCAAPAIITGYGVGRIGCQLSGDGDWGIANPHPIPDWWFLPNWIWSFDYPHNVAGAGLPHGTTPDEAGNVILANCNEAVDGLCYHLAQPAYPTPFYETMLCLAILLILWFLRKRIKVTGVLFFIYWILNGVERFLIENIRHNELYDFAGLQISQAQLIAIGMMIAGAAGAAYLWLSAKKETELLA